MAEVLQNVTESTSNTDSRMDIDSEDDDENCVVFEENVAIPLPLGSTLEGLTKQQGDPISNDIPFNITVSCTLIRTKRLRRMFNWHGHSLGHSLNQLN